MSRPILQPPWSDAQLSAAIEKSTNWRAVIRELGGNANSAGTVRVARRRATELGLDTSHFRGSRRWPDAQLRSVISGSRTWDEAASELGLTSSPANSQSFLKSHAIRLGIDYSHLADPQAAEPCGLGRSWPDPDPEHLREAAASIAAAWFTLSGWPVSLPIEPAVYDLLVDRPDGIKRVQVKTSTFNSKDGWQVNVGRKPYCRGDRRSRVPYEAGDIDFFFIVDGNLNIYLIPAAALAGAVRVSLRTYEHYVIGSAQGFGPLECQTS